MVVGGWVGEWAGAGALALSLCTRLTAGSPQKARSLDGRKKTQAHFDDATRRARDKDVGRDLSQSSS